MIFWDKVCRKGLMMLNPCFEMDYPDGILTGIAHDHQHKEREREKWRKEFYAHRYDFDNDPSWAD